MPSAPFKEGLKLLGLNLHFHLKLVFTVERILLHFRKFLADADLPYLNSLGELYLCLHIMAILPVVDSKEITFYYKCF